MKNTVVNEYGVEIDRDVAVNLMNDDLREELAMSGDYETEQDFFRAYCAAHLERFGEEWELAKKNPVY